RSGTENLPAIVGLAKALRMTMENRLKNTKWLYELRGTLLKQIENVSGIEYNGSSDSSQMAPHVVNISFPGMKAEVIVHWLEQKGIYVSTKSACASNQDKPSRILLAMGRQHTLANSGIR